MALTLGGYDRIVRHRGEGIEAVEIVWHPGTRTPKHNHGSKGWAWVLQGRVFEVRNGKKVYHVAGDAFLEVDHEEAHIVGNDTTELAVTFHVYQPELRMDTFSDSESPDCRGWRGRVAPVWEIAPGRISDARDIP
jgi:predicted metal-dependent enzyme (double-stranded beta helix superfamily)